MIPKVIHQIAPSDQGLWHPIWRECRASWQRHFESQHLRLWNDQEEIDKLVQQHLPEYWPVYQRFPMHMMRIDFAKFAILYVYGGIYADMDVFCYQDFHEELIHDIYLLECCYGDQPVENAIIASRPGHDFVLSCMEEISRRFLEVEHRVNIDYESNRQASNDLTLKITGPHLLADMYLSQRSRLDLLSGPVYNNHGLSYDPSYRTKHMLTGLWGREARDIIEKSVRSADQMDQHLVKIYLDRVRPHGDIKDLDWKDFDFYRDYTHGSRARQGLAANILTYG